MRIYKSFFVISFINIYFLGICNSELLSASKKVSKKQSTKNKKKPSSKNKRSLSSTNITATETEEEDIYDSEDNVDVNTAKSISNNLVIDTSPEAPAQTNETAVTTSIISASDASEEELKDVVNDSSWKDFKYCMQQQCMGGPEQPDNVECYKSVNFDTAFKSCKAMIADTSKQKLYERYFKEIFLLEEQSEACESIFSGKWNSSKNTCDITVTYVRSYKSKAKGAMKNDKVGCDDNTQKVFNLSSSGASIAFTCSHDVFNLDECYEDNAELQANEIGFYMGIAQAATGVVTAVASGAVAASQLKTETKELRDENNKVIGTTTGTKQKEVIDRKTGEKKTVDEKAGAWAGISAGLQAGQGAMLAGASAITQAVVKQKDVGSTVNGTCKLPDGTIKTEGSVVEIAW